MQQAAKLNLAPTLVRYVADASVLLWPRSIQPLK
jgi:hypothetical protein